MCFSIVCGVSISWWMCYQSRCSELRLFGEVRGCVDTIHSTEPMMIYVV
jgi:hypothetical protein